MTPTDDPTVAESPQKLVTQMRNARWPKLVPAPWKWRSPRSWLRGDGNDCDQL